MDDFNLDLIANSVATKVVGDINAIYEPRHDRLAQSAKDTQVEVAELRAMVTDLTNTVAGLTNTVAGLTNTVVGLNARLEEIEEHAGRNFYIGEALAEANGSDETPPEVLPARRPSAVDRACATAGTPDARPAILPQYGNLVIHPKQGYGSEQVYDDVLRSIEAVQAATSERNAVEGKRLRRPRRAR